MAKKLISVWLSLVIVLFSSVSIYAEDYVQGDFFNKKVVINGSEIVNYNLQYPFFLYKGTTYIPLSPDMGKICGFSTEMDSESRTLKLLKTEVTQSNISTNWSKNDGSDLKANVLTGVKVVAFENLAEETQEEEIDLKGMPILKIGNTIFLPSKAFKGGTIFKWDMYYDSYYGVCISTIEGKTAQSFWSEKESRYNKGLVNYILNYNRNISAAYAQDLVFMFKRAQAVYGVEDKLLMAIAHKESGFNAGVKSRQGATGLMQIMPKTGALYGARAEGLTDPRTNINIGASIISNGIKNYGGDVTKALSAYNQGSSRVSRGNYSTAYASRIMGAYSGVNNFLSVNGYK